ncbi:hypothetical protein B566_EDAN016578 [Ephemera danica]|nr:hypothetical protein B566_EDAN016578 [Ephemera danica]
MKYRKFNLFGEPALDNVEKEYATMSYFDALGTRFGLITCFDILYETPGVKLLRDFNVTDDFCCFVTYRLSPDLPSTFHYQFLAFDGITYHDGGIYANKLQICGVVACANEDVTSCNQHFDSSNYSLTTTFESLEIVGGFKSDIVWPNSFLSSSWEPLQPTQFQFTINEIQNNDFTVRFLLREPTVGIHTFALYSHDYEPYNVPSIACRTLSIFVNRRTQT